MYFFYMFICQGLMTLGKGLARSPHERNHPCVLSFALNPRFVVVAYLALKFQEGGIAI